MTDNMIEVMRDLTNHAESFWAFIQGEYGVRLSSDDKEDHNVYKFFQAIDAAKAALSTAQTRKEGEANSDSSVRAANRQNNAQPPSVMAGAGARDEIAAMLLDRDEGGDSLDWYRQFIHENRGTAHLAYSERGRSCVATVTCSRCVCDQALADADKIITALRSPVPGPVLSEEEHCCACCFCFWAPR